MHWKFKEGNVISQDILPLNYNLSNTDIALIVHNLDYYALIAYENGGAFLLVYKFDPILKTWSFYSHNQLGNLTPTISGFIHIDSDQRDHYFVVWDQLNPVGEIKVFGAAGAYNYNTGSLSLCTTNYEFPKFKDPTGTADIEPPYVFPDVAIMDYPTLGANSNPGQVKISFIGGSCSLYPNATQGLLCVSNELKFSQWVLCNFTPPNVNLSNIIPSTPDLQLYQPRIARHRRNPGAVPLPNQQIQEGYTIVYATQNSATSKWNINGLTVFYEYVGNSTIPIVHTTQNTYTDGSCIFYNLPNLQWPDNALPPIDFMQLHDPVVSYEMKSGSCDPNAYQVMCIAFNFYNGTTGVNSIASFYAHNFNGKPYCTNLANPFPNNYYSIPMNTVNESIGISVSGEQSLSFSYSWINMTNWKVFNKIVLSKNNLKAGDSQSNGVSDIKTIILSNEFTSFIFNELPDEINWVNADGKLLCSKRSEMEFVQQEIKSGISYLSFVNGDGSPSTYKLVKL